MVDKLLLYEKVKSFWSKDIQLDENTSKEEARELSYLARTYFLIESQVDENDHWVQLGVWAFHQALWQEATTALKAGRKAISRDNVSFAAFEARIYDNLQDPSWLKERTVWENPEPPA